MTAAARAGLFLYASNMSRVADFYEAVIGLQRLHTRDDLVVLDSSGVQLLVHQIPPHIAADIVITSPPEKREDSAMKFFFTVPSLAAARATAQAQGGEVFNENWQGPGFVVCNAMDPEGNIFQLREPTV